jgi:hypothetical protein
MSYKVLDLKHLSIVGESYWQHLYWCLYSAFIFAILIPIGLIHGFFPMFLANVPDNIMMKYVKNFKDRRIKTGQEESNPVRKLGSLRNNK